MKISAVVVTYNRLEKLKNNLQCLLQQEYELSNIYVIDNCSTDGTRDFLRHLNSDIIKPVFMRENTGGSGGFCKGVKIAYAEGADWIWIMDDDAYPEKNALRELIQSINELGDEACYWSNCDHDNFVEDNKAVDAWMFVGAMISRKVIDVVGIPRGDFFIYYDDLEYSSRIRKKGFPIYKVKKSIIIHQDAISDKIFQLNLFGKELVIPRLPKANWRLYYLIRNDILRFSYKDVRKYRVLTVRSFKRFLILLFSSPKQLGIFAKAYYHGMIGRSGKLMQPK